MKTNNKGFTLAELLIVVSIIAVLVAIAIPVFNNKLEKSREAVDLSNARSAYAQVRIAALSEEDSNELISVDENGTYSMEIEVSQQKEGWTTYGTITIGDIQQTDANWVGDPAQGGGSCTISYNSKNGALIVWSGESSIHSVLNSSYNYENILEIAKKKVGTASWCINSTCDQNNTIKKIMNELTDETFNSDIPTWAVVRDTKDGNANDNNNSYLMSTFDIKTLSAGTQIPAIYQLKDGTIQVGMATVNEADDKNGGKAYKIITKDISGNYAYSYQNGSSSKNTDYEYNNLLLNKKSYTSMQEAQKAYSELVAKYLKENPDRKEGKE